MRKRKQRACVGLGTVFRIKWRLDFGFQKDYYWADIFCKQLFNGYIKPPNFSKHPFLWKCVVRSLILHENFKKNSLNFIIFDLLIFLFFYFLLSFYFSLRAMDWRWVETYLINKKLSFWNSFLQFFIAERRIVLLLWNQQLNLKFLQWVIWKSNALGRDGF